MHALLRLSPQVGEVMINANRNLGAYESMGAPVWPGRPARLCRTAGRLPRRPRALRDARTWRPCRATRRFSRRTSSPAWPSGSDVDDAEIAIAATREDGELRLQPVFCLMRATVPAESLVRFTGSGRRKIDAWTRDACATSRSSSTTRARSSTPTLLAELRRLQR